MAMYTKQSTKNEFKVGDKVKLMTDDYRSLSPYGARGVVRYSAGDAAIVSFTEGNTVNFPCVLFVYSWELQKIENEPTTVKKESKQADNDDDITQAVNQMVNRIMGQYDITADTDGKKIVKASLYDRIHDRRYTGQAKCTPDDTFLYMDGLIIALDRLEKQIRADVEKQERTKREAEQAKKEQAKKFTYKDLKTGVFGRTVRGNWFVVVNDTLVYERGGYGRLDSCSFHASDDNLVSVPIELVVNARSFLHAKNIANLKMKESIIWQRET